MPKVNVPVLSFNSGELSPQIDARSDVEKYRAGCRILENMIPRSYGCATRRPGTKYITSFENEASAGRLIPFIYSSTIAYMILLEPYTARFFYDGGVLLDGGRAARINTPYAAADLFQLQFKQSNDVMWIVHPSYAPRKLTRTTATSFSLDTITFSDGPFMKRNDEANADSVTMTPSAVTGTGITLTASAATFVSTHVGALFKLTQPRAVTSTSGSKTAPNTGVIGSAILTEGACTFNMAQGWTGTVKLQRSIDAGVTWEDRRVYTSADGYKAVQYTFDEQDDNILHQINVTALSAGTAAGDLTVNSSTQDGICRVTAYTSATAVTVTVLKDFGQTSAETRWYEGCWSPYRGYPTAVTFFEERCIYAGSTYQPQTIWLSATDEYEEFEACTKDDSSFSLTLSSDTRNAIRWLASEEVILIGTTGGEWRLRSGTYDEPITPKPGGYSLKQQTTYGSKDIQAIPVNNVVMFVDFVARKLREMAYDGDTDRFNSPDLTALAEHITETGITSIAYQKNPDPILWATLTDGTLISMTYEREQNVIAWAKHPFESSPRTETIVRPTDYPTLYPADDTDVPDLLHTVAISNITELENIKDDMAGNYFLTQDIDCSVTAEGTYADADGEYGKGWLPIGSPSTAFTGTLDGCGYSITGLTMNRTGYTSGRGLFYNVTGTVANLTVNVDFTVGAYAGGMCYYANSYVTGGGQPKFYNCHTSGTIVAASTAVVGGIGGFVGYVQGRSDSGSALFYDCTSSVAIDFNGTHTDAATSHFGGFIAVADARCGFYNCQASGALDVAGYGATPQFDYVGGFVGYASDTYCIFNDCSATGSVKGDRYVGGFVGTAGTAPTFARCYATGDVEAYVLRAGGFGGQLSNVSVTDCYAWGDVTTASDYCGGFCGGSVSATFRQCYAIGAVSGGTVGGFLGTKSGTASAPTCYWDTDTSGTSDTATAGADGRDTDTMKTKSEYGSTWDFDDVWYMTDDFDYAHSIESVAVIPSTDEDEVWITTARYINGTLRRYVEQMQPRDFGDQEDAFFVDCGLSYDGGTVAADEFSGLDHLEGETVAILGDGAVFGTQVVTNGALPTALDEEVIKCIIGLPFTYKLKPMRFDLTTQSGTTKGSIKRISEIVISFFETLNCRYGRDEDNLFDIYWRKEEAYGEPPELYTGDKVKSIEGGFDPEDSVLLTGSDPLPCTIRAIVPRMKVTGR